MGDAYIGHTCYLFTWWAGTKFQFQRVVQGTSSTYDGWKAVFDVNGEHHPSLSLGTDLPPVVSV